MMKKIIPILILLLVSPAQAYDFRTIADQHILPGYQQFNEATNTLETASKNYCDNPNQATLTKLKSVYRDSFNSWQSVQHIRFGPIQYLNRAHRFEMWPDKRGSVGKHLARLLQDPEIKRTDFDISSKSVAVQGFPALERLVFSNKPVDEVSCILIKSISQNLNNMARNLENNWISAEGPFVDYFVSASQGNDIYESDIELASKILNSLYTQLEFIATQKLDRPLGKNISKARGKRAEGWRSKNSLLAIEANLVATKSLYQLTFSNQLSEPLTGNIDQAYQQAFKSLVEIKLPLHQAVSDPEQRKSVEQLRKQLSVLKALIGRDLSSELDLSLGFNSLDGD